MCLDHQVPVVNPGIRRMEQVDRASGNGSTYVTIECIIALSNMRQDPLIGHHYLLHMNRNYGVGGFDMNSASYCEIYDIIEHLNIDYKLSDVLPKGLLHKIPLLHNHGNASLMWNALLVNKY